MKNLPVLLAGLGGIAIGAIAHRIAISSTIDKMEELMDGIESDADALGKIIDDEYAAMRSDDVVSPEDVGIPSEVFDRIGAFAHEKAEETGLPVLCVIRSNA